MKSLRFILSLSLITFLMLFVRCDDEALFPDKQGADLQQYANKGRPPVTEVAGNNLSFPVIWADDYEKLLPGVYNEYSLNGAWWYVWGEDPIDPNAPVYGCAPDPNNPELCIDGTTPGGDGSIVYKAYLQKDINNKWQAFNATQDGALYVDEIDWGDDLESVN